LSGTDEEKTRWGQVMENFNLLYARINDMGIIQQEVKQQLAAPTLKVEQCIADQHFIAQKVKANGQAIAQLTLKQFERENGSVSEGLVIADDDTMFENVFAKGKTYNKGEPSHQFKNMPPPGRTICLITPYQRCISQLLMVSNQRSSLINVTTISPYILYLSICG
jgi:hypothetical protein